MYTAAKHTFLFIQLRLDLEIYASSNRPLDDDNHVGFVGTAGQDSELVERNHIYRSVLLGVLPAQRLARVFKHFDLIYGVGPRIINSKRRTSDSFSW